ncbi:MAG TPA: hypothetical protein PLB12_12195 [Candidatus Goldiibacteriota bacterium]|nr:hypothetical protein [Candidatus Goldiibacteriota bacterium]
MGISESVMQQVVLAVRDSNKDIIGYDGIPNDAHAKTFLGIAKTFGKNPCGFIYCEANHPRNTHKPADIVLCDTETGVISIEVKAYDITRIERVVAGSKLFVKLGGEIKETAPWEQARSCMFDIRNEFERRFSASKIPWFSYMTAFPNIAQSEWKDKFGEASADFGEIIFSDDLKNLSLLKSKVSARAIPPGYKKKVENPVDTDGIEKLKSVFGDSAVLYKLREAREVTEVDNRGRTLS